MAAIACFVETRERDWVACVQCGLYNFPTIKRHFPERMTEKLSRWRYLNPDSLLQSLQRSLYDWMSDFNLTCKRRFAPWCSLSQRNQSRQQDSQSFCYWEILRIYWGDLLIVLKIKQRSTHFIITATEKMREGEYYRTQLPGLYG